jgi:predicted Rossmann fold nucleotide-binding protein DprA/Smf involved in DNA uptake
LGNSLTRAVVSKKFRDALREGKLVLISPFDPDAGFNVGNAMARNKYIYALSDWALVVNAALNKGGTWAGATENLRNGWVPLFVYSSSMTSSGNKNLIEKGGIKISDGEKDNRDLKNWFAKNSISHRRKSLERTTNQLPLL